MADIANQSERFSKFFFTSSNVLGSVEIGSSPLLGYSHLILGVVRRFREISRGTSGRAVLVCLVDVD